MAERHNSFYDFLDFFASSLMCYAKRYQVACYLDCCVDLKTRETWGTWGTWIPVMKVTGFSSSPSAMSAHMRGYSSMCVTCHLLTFPVNPSPMNGRKAPPSGSRRINRRCKQARKKNYLLNSIVSFPATLPIGHGEGRCHFLSRVMKVKLMPAYSRLSVSKWFTTHFWNITITAINNHLVPSAMITIINGRVIISWKWWSFHSSVNRWTSPWTARKIMAVMDPVLRQFTILLERLETLRFNN